MTVKSCCASRPSGRNKFLFYTGFSACLTHYRKEQHMNSTPLSPESDALIRELRKHEVQLQAWLQSSAVNALWFLVDPVDALRAANLGLPEDLLLELEQTIKSLENKLGSALSQPLPESMAAPAPSPGCRQSPA